MPERYITAILKYLGKREQPTLGVRQLARMLGVAEKDYGTFREAVKILRDSGQVVMGAKDSLLLPQMAKRVVGVFRANPRGFGFVIPDTPNAHGDLFIPPGRNGGAITGDHVSARVLKRGRREKQLVFEGEVAEILQRGNNRFVGTLEKAEDAWFVVPEGKGIVPPIVVRDVGTARAKVGSKVVVEMLTWPEPGRLATGVIVENLGQAGPTIVETMSIIRAHGLAEEFSAEGLHDARRAIEAFDPLIIEGREDLTASTIVTIDPPDARDFDDAISLHEHTGREAGMITLGVHIADVSHFVREDSDLDLEARGRGTSVYFPRKVLPMLPEVLSNGVCSLQQGQRRFCKSVFITYDREGRVLATRFCESVIMSAARLTYDDAQAICDGKPTKHKPPVVQLVRRMEKLARTIEARRIVEGALTLDLPEVSLVFDAEDRVIDAVPEDHSYSHTIIEMFMVEANEAVASLLDRLDRAFLRRVHPAPDTTSTEQLTTFVRACGHRLPRELSRHDMQALLKAVKGKPESYAINLAILKMFQQAEYSPMRIGHFALASKNYCHFTSPIRRYPDLTVHRLLAEYCRGVLGDRPPEDISALVELGQKCSATERHAESAEDELRTILLLQHLASKVGESFDGVITGVTNFGLFVQSPRYLIDGLVRMEHLGDDWFELDARYGHLKGERTGKTYRIGDLIRVTIANVNIPRRQLDLVPEKLASIKRQAEAKTKPKPERKGKQQKKAKPASKQRVRRRNS